MPIDRSVGLGFKSRPAASTNLIGVTAVLVSPTMYPQEVFDAYDNLHGPS